MTNTRRSLLLLAVASLALTGCEDVTGGGDKEVVVYAVGNGGAQGTVEFDAAVSLISAQGEEFHLTTGTVNRMVEVAGGARTLLVQRRVDAVEYTRARVVFTQVVADVTGLIVGGLPLPGRLEVDVPAGGSVTVERTIEMTLPARSREVLVIDLNTAAWLPAVDRLTRRVPASTFRDAVELRLE